MLLLDSLGEMTSRDYSGAQSVAWLRILVWKVPSAPVLEGIPEDLSVECVSSSYVGPSAELHLTLLVCSSAELGALSVVMHLDLHFFRNNAQQLHGWELIDHSQMQLHGWELIDRACWPVCDHHKAFEENQDLGSLPYVLTCLRKTLLWKNWQLPFASELLLSSYDSNVAAAFLAAFSLHFLQTSERTQALSSFVAPAVSLACSSSHASQPNRPREHRSLLACSHTLRWILQNVL